MQTFSPLPLKPSMNEIDHKIAKKKESIPSSLVSRNVTIASHRTSMRLEPDMGNGLREICRREHLSIHEIATAVHMRKPSNSSLTAAMRVFIMAYFRAAATEDGHSRAGHGPGGSFIASLVAQNLATSAASLNGTSHTMTPSMAPNDPPFHRMTVFSSR